MKHRITTEMFTPNKRKPIVVMACPEAKCEHVYQALCSNTPCPRCGNRNVVPASMWNVDEKALLRMGKLPVHLPKKGARHGK